MATTGVLRSGLGAARSSMRSIRAPVAARFFSVTAADFARISDTIKKDHSELREQYNNIIEAKDQDTKERWQNQFTWSLARHSIGEELVVYPAFESNLPDGKDMAEKDRSHHRIVKEKLYKFQKLGADNPDFIPTLKGLWEDLSQHIKEEEQHDLPALEDTLDADKSESMSRSLERTKMFVPTRSHPSAPDKPPYETVAGLLTLPFDKLSDMFRKFPKGPDDK